MSAASWGIDCVLGEEDIRGALRDCFDAGNPFQQPLNVVELGLVEAIRLEVDSEAPGYGITGVPVRSAVWVELVASSSDGDAQAMLQAQIENRLAGMAGLSRWSVRFVSEPVWTPQRMAAELRRRLKVDKPLFPILNKSVRQG